MKKILIPVILAAMIFSCSKSTPSTTYEEGLKPVYISKANAFNLKVETPTTFTYPGKMFLYQSLILVTDVGEGVHILDNSNPVNPKKIAFISIPGVNDASIKNGILYADNFTDLVAFDISNMSNIQFIKRLKNIYPLINQLYPEFATGYFECADTTKGYILRWEKSTLTNPKCYR
ncbi:MAG: hypothetical protein AUJ98_11595 [Bacteroidetes bacterium CG2_30_33_31]|nr:MAG: hypothetical protein AUJ98_11595 [Bacteroidetes bacterium CG2_30_33_31]